jgi:hypothetical protein
LDGHACFVSVWIKQHHWCGATISCIDRSRCEVDRVALSTRDLDDERGRSLRDQPIGPWWHWGGNVGVRRDVVGVHMIYPSDR